MAETGIVSFQQRVKEKLKDTVADLIPDDQWDELVSNITQEFLTKDLSVLVKAELAEHYKKIIRDALNSPEWKEGKWSDTMGQYAASELVTKIAVEAGPLIFQQVIANIIQTNIYAIRNSINNTR